VSIRLAAPMVRKGTSVVPGTRECTRYTPPAAMYSRVRRTNASGSLSRSSNSNVEQTLGTLLYRGTSEGGAHLTISSEYFKECEYFKVHICRRILTESRVSPRDLCRVAAFLNKLRFVVIAVFKSKFLKRYSTTKRRAPAYSRRLLRISMQGRPVRALCDA